MNENVFQWWLMMRKSCDEDSRSNEIMMMCSWVGVVYMPRKYIQTTLKLYVIPRINSAHDLEQHIKVSSLGLKN